MAERGCMMGALPPALLNGDNGDTGAHAFDCSLEFVFSLLLLQPFDFSPVSFACNFQD